VGKIVGKRRKGERGKGNGIKEEKRELEKRKWKRQYESGGEERAGNAVERGQENWKKQRERGGKERVGKAVGESRVICILLLLTGRLTEISGNRGQLYINYTGAATHKYSYTIYARNSIVQHTSPKTMHAETA
jgi:hypothetical protein